MGAATQIVEVQATPRAHPRNVRISSKVKAAIDLMVHSGVKRDVAAMQVGISDISLRQALSTTHVRAYRLTQLEVIRSSEGARTYARIAKLADEADSEHVRLDASKHLGALDGISPVQRTETAHRFPDGAPGLTIVMNNGPTVQQIDGQSHEIEFVSREKHLSKPVPHPCAGTSRMLQCTSPGEGRNRGENREAATETGGEKSGRAQSPGYIAHENFSSADSDDGSDDGGSEDFSGSADGSGGDESKCRSGGPVKRASTRFAYFEIGEDGSMVEVEPPALKVQRGGGPVKNFATMTREERVEAQRKSRASVAANRAARLARRKAILEGD